MRAGLASVDDMKSLYEPQQETEHWAENYKDPMSEQYSPEQTDYGPVGYRDMIHDSVEGTPVLGAGSNDFEHGMAVTYGRARLGLPPDPTVGGEVGSFDRLGWTKGIREWRWLRQPMKGEMLRLSGSKAHPTDGPVGKTDWLNALAENVNYQFVELIPTPETVAAGFTFATPETVERWAEG